MKICELLKSATQSLKSSGITDTARLDAEVLLAHTLGCERLRLITDAQNCVKKEQEELFLSFLKRRLGAEPVSYILGSREFMSLKFSVSEGVLIPRPDTEILAEFAIEKAQNIKHASVLDLCTGSGALAVSISSYVPSASVTAVDFSEKCVAVAQKNAADNGVLSRVKVIKQDILEDFNLNGEKFDLLVSNPPYIKTSVISSLDKTVKDFEPMAALDGGDDGLVFYRQIAKIAPVFLKSGGLLAMEIGHDQSGEVHEILKSNGRYRDIEFLLDLQGIKRVIYAALV